MTRRAGVLLHPSSLPGPFGVGEIGPAARELLAWLEAADQRVWQVLPLNPVDDEGCPYASPSAFAREPLLLSCDDLCEDGWLKSAEKPYAPGRPGTVDWRGVRERKTPALLTAADRVRGSIDLAAYERQQPEIAAYALYRAIDAEQQKGWPWWPQPLRDRDPDALASARDRLSVSVERELALQWLFDTQWERLRTEARIRGIELWGDVPIFVGWVSSDVWERPHLWRLDADRNPVAVSGVPPDAFSENGQLWGHPMYDEDAHRAEGHAWWLARMERTLRSVDRVRIDHFRGIEAVWESPAGAQDARGGRWIPGPGVPLMEALRSRFPTMPFVAEDLGVITDEVRAIRDAYGLPGMVILQFAFGGDPADPQRSQHPYLPHNHRPNQVCFTGTHDNDTLAGWYSTAHDAERDHVRRYLGATDRDLPWSLLREAWRSVANTTIVPMQDLLGLGSDARMNIPGVTGGGNWSWRMRHESLSLVLAQRVAEQVRLFGRGRPGGVREPAALSSAPAPEGT